MLRLRSLGLALALSLAATACQEPQSASEPVKLQVLRIGVLPDQSKEVLELRYQPLMGYLENAIGIRTELLIPDSYAALLALFDRRVIDVAWFGGLTFVRADSSSQADPLVMRTVDLEFTTDFLVRQGAEGKSLEDFAGQRLSFGPRLSTSGHLMPRHYLNRREIDPEATFSSIVHSTGHDQTLIWVRDGEVDVGAANSVIVESMFAAGSVSRDEVRVLERTPPYTNYVWAVQPSLSKTVRSRLLDAFLALDLRIQEHRDILDALGASGFVPASRFDFADLKEAAEMLTLIDSEHDE